jgi:hypothetical protein
VARKSSTGTARLDFGLFYPSNNSTSYKLSSPMAVYSQAVIVGALQPARAHCAQPLHSSPYGKSIILADVGEKTLLACCSGLAVSCSALCLWTPSSSLGALKI